MNLKILMTTLLIIYTISMIVVAALPQIANIEGVAGNDKLLHAVEFFIFTLLLLTTLSIDELNNYYLISLIIVLAVVLVSELVQIPVIGRSFSVKDMIADLSGSAAAYIIFFLARLEWKSLKR